MGAKEGAGENGGSEERRRAAAVACRLGCASGRSYRAPAM